MRTAASPPRLALLLTGVALISALLAMPAAAQSPGLPRSYQIERIDSPAPTAAASFGLQAVPIGDVNADGEEDLATTQTVGTPNSEGRVWVYSGETGGLLGTFTAPDPGNPGNVANNNRALVDRWMDRLGDIGSCPANTAPGQTCESPTVGPPDGRADFFLGAEGVDVGGVRDVGRVYVIDGQTLSVLKRIDMPPADRQLVADRQAQFPLPGTNVTAGFGRTAITPRGLPVCAGNAGVTPCPPATDIPQPVRIGDIDGAGQPEIVIGANFFTEIPQTANPSSHCAQAPANTICFQTGRAYIYRGEEVANSNPAVVLDGTGPGQTPPKVIRNPAAQADTPDQAAFVRAEAFGHAVMPVGDVGQCRSGGAFPVANPGDRCSRVARTNVRDGRPDVIISAHLADGPFHNPDPSRFNEGVSFLIDGSTGAILHVINAPETQASAFFGYTTRQTFPFGQLFGTPLPDYVQASWQNYDGKPGAGRLYVLNGDFNNPFAVLNTLNDPTPTTNERFGVAREGVGDLVPGNTGGEALIGNFPFNETFPDGLTDVHFMNLLDGEELQRIPDPDQQRASLFGYQVSPLGDLNEDGFLDFATSSPSWDAPGTDGNAGVLNQGRMYIYRSDDSPAPGPGPAPKPPPPVYPVPPVGPSAFAGCPVLSANVIQGSAASNTITGTPLGDRIFAGTGDDKVDGVGGGDCIDLGLGDDVGEGGLGDDLVLGEGGTDKVNGDAGDDRLRGGSGSDRVNGGFGNDSIHGQAGKDTLIGSRGRDGIRGGLGQDEISGGSGNDRVAGHQGDDGIRGGSGNDVLRANSGNDRVAGGSGRDRIFGGRGGDGLRGNAGNDVIVAGAGRDRVSGGKGDDRINARDKRRDRVNCGPGRDVVIADRSDVVADNCERVRRR